MGIKVLVLHVRVSRAIARRYELNINRYKLLRGNSIGLEGTLTITKA